MKAFNKTQNEAKKNIIFYFVLVEKREQKAKRKTQFTSGCTLSAKSHEIGEKSPQHTSILISLALASKKRLKNKRDGRKSPKIRFTRGIEYLWAASFEVTSFDVEKKKKKKPRRKKHTSPTAYYCHYNNHGTREVNPTEKKGGRNLSKTFSPSDTCEMIMEKIRHSLVYSRQKKFFKRNFLFVLKNKSLKYVFVKIAYLMMNKTTCQSKCGKLYLIFRILFSKQKI